MESYIKSQKKILKHLCIWSKMTTVEKTHFENLSTEFEVDRFKRTMLNQYL